MVTGGPRARLPKTQLIFTQEFEMKITASESPFLFKPIIQCLSRIDNVSHVSSSIVQNFHFCPSCSDLVTNCCVVDGSAPLFFSCFSRPADCFAVVLISLQQQHGAVNKSHGERRCGLMRCEISARAPLIASFSLLIPK